MPSLTTLGGFSKMAFNSRNFYRPGTPSYLGTFVTQNTASVNGIDCSSVQVGDLVIILYGVEGVFNNEPSFELGTQSLTTACYITNSNSQDESTGIFYCIATSAIAGLTNLTLNAQGATSNFRAAAGLFILRGSSSNSLVEAVTNKNTSSYSTTINFKEGILFQVAYSDLDWTSMTFTNGGTTVFNDMGSASSDFSFAYNFTPISQSTSIGYTTNLTVIAYSAAVFR